MLLIILQQNWKYYSENILHIRNNFDLGCVWLPNPILSEAVVLFQSDRNRPWILLLGGPLCLLRLELIRLWKQFCVLVYFLVTKDCKKILTKTHHYCLAELKKHASTASGVWGTFCLTGENIRQKITKFWCILQFVRNCTLFITNNWQTPANIDKI